MLPSTKIPTRNQMQTQSQIQTQIISNFLQGCSQSASLVSDFFINMTQLLVTWKAAIPSDFNFTYKQYTVRSKQ